MFQDRLSPAACLAGVTVVELGLELMGGSQKQTIRSGTALSDKEGAPI